MGEDTDATIADWLQSVPENGIVPDDLITRLSRFVQGFFLNLPPDEEPYLPLYDLAVAHRSVARIANAVRALLQRWVDGKWRPALPERAHFNLLQLCIEIADRRRLSGPIWELYRRKLVSGDYNSLRQISLITVLLQAMIRNPSDGSGAAELWQRFLDGQHDEYLNGSPLDGFLGMLYLPHDSSPEARIAQLARCLHVLHKSDEEMLFLNALNAMKRAEPALAREILERAGLDICKAYLAVVGERGPEVIEETLRQKNQIGNYGLQEDLGYKWAEVYCKLQQLLRQQAGLTKLRTRTQLEGLFASLVSEQFYSPHEENAYRIFAQIARERAGLRIPESLKPQKSNFTHSV